jgi:hypothetical protein
MLPLQMSNPLPTITPPRITRIILIFCRELDPTQVPLYLTVKAESGCEVNNCFLNVKDKFEKDGGGIQFGWRIVEIPGIMIEAEFHAVWVSLDQQYSDITPKEESEILFLPDSVRQYDYSSRKWVDNKRKPLSNKAAVIEFITLEKEFVAVQEKFIVDKNLETHIDELRPYGVKFKEVFQKLPNERLGKNAPCPCGSGKKYKKCCG